MSDLCERLLKQAEAWDGEPGNLLEEAADEIASLRAQLAQKQTSDEAEIFAWVETINDRRDQELTKLRAQLASARKALERIEKSDRRWVSPYAMDAYDIIERAPSGNVLVHGPEGRIARDALLSLTPDHREIQPSGMQKGYVVLSAEERARGFVQPVRRTYVHKKCGVATTMGLALAETYARDPKFYTGTYCVGCRTHFTFGQPDGEFTWDDGSRVGE